MARKEVALSFALWMAAAAAATLPAQAAVIYDNGAVAPYDSSAPSDPSGLGIALQAAAPFSLSVGQSTITDVHWTGHYRGSNAAGIDAFTLQFFNDAGGAPAETPFLSLAIRGSVSRTDTGTDVFGSDVYRYAVDIAPVALAAGTSYWLSIFNDTPNPRTTWAWTLDEAGGGAFALRVFGDAQWDVFSGRPDFQLTGDAAVGKVPEPGTLALVGLGLLAAGRARRSRAALR